MHDKTSLAVQASLAGNWEEAIELNTTILLEDPTCVAALNRLGRAYIELGQKDSAKQIYQKVLQLDKYNSVALRTLKILPAKKTVSGTTFSQEKFIEEPGVTKTTELIKVAGRDVLMGLSCKETLSLAPRARLIALKSTLGVTIGCLPDDLSLRLAKLVKSGYSYTICVKAVDGRGVSVFIREIKRPARLTAAPSFSRTISLKPLVKKA